MLEEYNFPSVFVYDSQESAINGCKEFIDNHRNDFVKILEVKIKPYLHVIFEHEVEVYFLTFHEYDDWNRSRTYYKGDTLYHGGNIYKFPKQKDCFGTYNEKSFKCYICKDPECAKASQINAMKVQMSE